MAIGALIYKININLSNFNTHYYKDFNLTIAKHPSENEARMMYRLLCFLYCAHEDLEFTKGLSTTEEPELWQKDLTGEIVHWIELGQPDEKRIKQALGKSKEVTIFTSNQNTAHQWDEKIRRKIFNQQLKIFHFYIIENGPLDRFVERGMTLSCTIEDNIIYLGNEQERIGIEVQEGI